jgi:hypothetical protein
MSKVSDQLLAQRWADELDHLEKTARSYARKS